MNKNQRIRKNHYRERWGWGMSNGSPHNLSYPMWLEEQLEHVEDHRRKVMKICLEKDRYSEVYAQYIQDMEIGLKVVKRCASTSRPGPFMSIDDRKTVLSSIRSLEGILKDAKQRFFDGKKIRLMTKLASQT